MIFLPKKEFLFGAFFNIKDYSKRSNSHMYGTGNWLNGRASDSSPEG